MTRTFESGPARRARMPLMIAIVGASGAGKTLSAILLAEGIKRVQPGPIVVIDTESLRALKHSDGNPDRFIHVPFAPPFGPLDYVAAIKHALKHQPSTIIVDSISHEHEGEGGVLDQHDTMVAEKGQNYDQIAWKKPKGDRTKLKHFILQQRCNWVFCFRAKEKIKPKKGGEPEDLGWQPLGAEELIFEMDLCALLYPGVDGRPKWKSPRMQEQQMMKLPGWWRALFAGEPQLNPDIGEQLARWAVGGDVAAPSSNATSSRTTSPAPHLALIDLFDACDTSELLESTKAEMKARWESIPKGDARSAVARARERAEERVEAARQKANNA
jgi:hypothetical protein